LNGKHLRKMEIEDLFGIFHNWLLNFRKDDAFILENHNKDYIMKVMEICREKVNTLVQLLEMVKPFLIDEYEYSEEYIKSFISETRSLEILKKALDDFKDKEFKNIEDIRTLLENVAKELEIKKRVVFQIIRGALLGKLITPGLFESIKVLGKNRTIQRLKRTIEIGGSWLKNVSP